MDTKLQEYSTTPVVDTTTNETIEQLLEDKYLDALKRLQVDLSEKSSECELLKIKLDESNQNVEVLSRELNGCKLTMFENDEDSKKSREEVIKSKKLEEDYVKLMKEYVDLEERTNQYKQNLIDKYHAKTNAINNYECLMSSGAITVELEECKQNLDNRSSELYLAQAKLRNLEEDAVLKEKTITELRKVLDDAKVTHKHEINVLEEYILCLKNTITSYEKTLANYSEQKTEEA